jgi:hypothetical protein
MLIWDSKAGALHSGLFRTSMTDENWIFIGGTNQYTSPLPILSDNPLYRPFYVPSKLILNEVSKEYLPNIIVVAVATRNLLSLSSTSSFWELESNENYDVALEGLSNAIKLLKSKGKKPIFVIDNPAFPDSRQCLDRRSSVEILNLVFNVNPNQDCYISLSRYESQIAKYRSMLNKLKELYPNNF